MSSLILCNTVKAENPFYFDYKKPSLEPPSNICSYLDIIYNNDYNNSKSLESINYILNYFDNRYSLDAENIYNVAEDGLRRRYAGYYLDVYTVGTLITLEMVLMEVIMNYPKLNLQELVIIFIIIQVLNKMKFMLLLKKI